MKNWFLILCLILLSGCITKGTDNLTEETKGIETTRYAWEEKQEGVWTRTDLECDSIIEHLCVSNCYESAPECPWDSSIVESAETDTGKAVICFNQGCRFQDCDIICPA